MGWRCTSKRRIRWRRNSSNILRLTVDEIEALTIFYTQPHRRRELTFEMIREVFGQAQE